MADATRIVLVRHGEAQVAVDQIVGGHEGCTGLSELGRRQAEALRDRLARTGELGEVHALYASVLPRAVETAEILAPALGGIDVRQECGLCEVHPGEADGMAWQEFRETYVQFEPSQETQHMPWAPGAESWAEFAVRAGTALWQLVHDHPGETVVVACHGGVVQASFHAYGNQPVWRAFDLYTENTSLTEWTKQGDTRPWLLVRYNDAAHLHDLA